MTVTEIGRYGYLHAPQQTRWRDRVMVAVCLAGVSVGAASWGGHHALATSADALHGTAADTLAPEHRRRAAVAALARDVARDLDLLRSLSDEPGQVGADARSLLDRIR